VYILQLCAQFSLFSQLQFHLTFRPFSLEQIIGLLFLVTSLTHLPTLFMINLVLALDLFHRITHLQASHLDINSLLFLQILEVDDATIVIENFGWQGL